MFQDDEIVNLKNIKKLSSLDDRIKELEEA